MSATSMQVGNYITKSDKEWEGLFPKHVTENYLSSLTFVKQLTFVAVSSITYLRSALPEESYAMLPTLDGIKLKILKAKCEDALAQFLMSSLKQAFEAIDKKFVHRLALCFYHGDCVADNLFEYYTFEYSYNADGVTNNPNSNNEAFLKSKTNRLVRSLVVFIFQNSRGELPINYDIRLRPHYTEDCPENEQASAVWAEHLGATIREEVCLGWVETPYVTLIVRAFVRDAVGDRNDSAASDFTGQPERRQAEHEDSQAELPREVASAPPPEPRVRCPCRRLGGQGEELLVCQCCHTLQHAVCFGLLTPVPGASPAHCCAACAARGSAPAATPACRLLVGLSARRQQSLCLFRRALVLCLQTAAVSGAQLQAHLQLSATSTAMMLRLLAAHDIMPECDYADLEMPRNINHLRLKVIMKMYFQMDDAEDDTGDNLMMEEGQEATDPAAEMPAL